MRSLRRSAAVPVESSAAEHVHDEVDALFGDVHWLREVFLEDRRRGHLSTNHFDMKGSSCRPDDGRQQGKKQGKLHDRVGHVMSVGEGWYLIKGDGRWSWNISSGLKAGSRTDVVSRLVWLPGKVIMCAWGHALIFARDLFSCCVFLVFPFLIRVNTC